MRAKFLLTSLLGLAVFSIAPATQAYSADQYTFVAAITDIERVGNQPIPTQVTWVQSITSEDGVDVTLDHFEVVVLDGEEEIGRVTVPATDRSIVLNKTNVPDMKVFTRYAVRVDEYYTDSSSEEGFTQNFYTAAPKLKNLRVVDKVVGEDGKMTVTLKWRLPTNLKNDYIYYDFKIAKANQSEALVVEDYEWGLDVVSATVSNLPRQKMKFRVRARDDYYGSGPWSAWKTFNAPKS